MAEMDPAAARAQLDEGLRQMRLRLSDEQRDQLIAFLELLHRWGKTYNLTAIRDPGAMVCKHLLDSLSALPYLFGDSVLDLGTGAGLPGIPLAVAAPERAFHLLDSSGKKTRFVRQVAMDLALANVTVIQARIESYLPERKFATIISRAVASVPDLLAAGARLVTRPGRLLTMKGQWPGENELRRLEASSVTVKIHRLEMPFLVGERHLIDVRYD